MAENKSATVGCENGDALACDDRAKLGMPELLRGTKASVGAERMLWSELVASRGAMRAAECKSSALLAAECGAVPDEFASSCVARISIGPSAGSLKKLWPGRSSIGAGGGNSERLKLELGSTDKVRVAGAHACVKTFLSLRLSQATEIVQSTKGRQIQLKHA